MIKNFTEENLLRYLCEELPSQEQQSEKCVKPSREEFVYVTEESKSILEGFMLESSQKTIDNILAYSRNF